MPYFFIKAFETEAWRHEKPSADHVQDQEFLKQFMSLW